jgi:hypothetical protein
VKSLKHEPVTPKSDEDLRVFLVREQIAASKERFG